MTKRASPSRPAAAPSQAEALFVLSVAMSAPDAPSCFSLDAAFPEQVAHDIGLVLRARYPMFAWNVDVRGTDQ